MYYVELLRASRCVLVTACVVTVSVMLNVVLVWTHVNKSEPTGSVELSFIFLAAAVVASIVATVLGGSLACENEGHLPVAWTKPASRVNHALTKILVDVSAVLVIFAFTCAAVFAGFALLGFASVLSVPPDTFSQLLRFLMAPLAFYGLMQGLTASLSRGAGMVIGLTWVALFILLILDAVPLPKPYHGIFEFVNYANPIIYMFVDDSGGKVSVAFQYAADTAGLLVIALVGASAALFQWRRLEA